MLQNKCYKKEKCCTDLVICILITLLAFSIGLLLGALTAIIVFLNLGALIALIAILAILLVIRIINLVCGKDKEKDKNNCCCYNDYDKYC